MAGFNGTLEAHAGDLVGCARRRDVALRVEYPRELQCQFKHLVAELVRWNPCPV